MPLPFVFESDARTIQDKLFDVLMELDYFVDRISEIKNEIAEIWEGMD